MLRNEGRPLQLALIGAGLFTKDAYIPLCRRHCSEVQVRAIWSRSERAASGLLPLIHECVKLLVAIMTKVAVRALHAGKHVLQEKPIASSVAAASPALVDHRNLKQLLGKIQPLVWALAENYRSEKGFHHACQLLPQLGTIIKLDLVADMPMNSTNKYFPSQWRRDAEGCPGGFVMDSCVHHIAALRTVGQAAGLGEVVEASATATSISPDLPPPDTVVGSLKFASGTPAGISVTFAGSVLRFSLSVTGTAGSLEVLRGGWGGPKPGYTLSYQSATSEGAQVEQVPFSGLDDELTAFVHLVNCSKTSKEHDADAAHRISIEEGARDLAVIEALLESSKTGSQSVAVSSIS